MSALREALPILVPRELSRRRLLCIMLYPVDPTEARRNIIYGLSLKVPHDADVPTVGRQWKAAIYAFPAPVIRVR